MTSSVEARPGVAGAGLTKLNKNLEFIEMKLPEYTYDDPKYLGSFRTEDGRKIKILESVEFTCFANVVSGIGSTSTLIDVAKCLVLAVRCIREGSIRDFADRLPYAELPELRELFVSLRATPFDDADKREALACLLEWTVQSLLCRAVMLEDEAN